MAYGLLILDKDSTCAKIVSKVLNACKHEELHKGKVLDCLDAIWRKKDELEPILLTNINRLGQYGIMLENRIRMFFEIEIIQMTPDEEVIGSRRCQPMYASAYVINISSIDKMNHLWSLAMNDASTDHHLLARNNPKMIPDQFQDFRLSTEEGSSSRKAITMPSDYCPPKNLSVHSTSDQESDNVLKDTEAHCPSTGDGTSSQESSLPQAEGINAFLEGMETSGALRFWRGV